MSRRRAALLAVGLAAAGCGPAPSAPAATTTAAASAPPPIWRVRGPGGQRPIEVGTTELALLDAERCAGCHAAIAAEWRTSRHGRAWTNGIFQREYSAQPKPWCVNCHAPTPPQQAELAAGGHALADQGINCATCHVRAGKLVAAHRAPGSPHATVVEPSFGSPAFCADCHDFTFPVLSPAGEAVRMTSHPMQATVTSFLAGPYAREPAGCMTCHDSQHGHAFAGGHDPDMLDAALDVTWCRRGAALEVAVANVAAGHAVPTGDVHRHLQLRVWRSSAPAGVWEAFFGRRFDEADDGGKRTIWDSSLAPNATRRFTVALAALAALPDGEVDADPAEPLNLELTYVFIGDEFPRPGRAPSEPGSTSVVRWRTPPGAIEPCASP